MSVLASSLTFQQLVVDGVLSPIHQAFGDTLQRLDPSASPEVLLAAVLCSEQLARGHVCLDLPSAHAIVFPTSETDSRIRQYDNWPEESSWVDNLQNSPLVTVVERGSNRKSLSTPLVLDLARRRLYLTRYWYFEQRLAVSIADRLKLESLTFDEARLQNDIASLFPDRQNSGSRDQCLAVANSVDRWFSVITGGPGTGKTTTVAKLLALRLLQHLASENDPGELRILLMAPTGKAAQRLNESLSRATQQLNVDAQVLEALQQISAGTIHRMLGWTPLPPERGGPFRHRAEVPLEADIVLVDEASMVDLALMCRLFDAIPQTAQVILIGDRDQLASVEAGGVLSDLCGNLAGETIDRLGSERRHIIAQRAGVQIAQSDSEESSGKSRDTQSAKGPTGRKTSVSRRRKKAHPKQMALPLGEGWEGENDLSESPGDVERSSGVVKSRKMLATPDQAAGLLAESVATLNYSHRFSTESSLGQLAAAIRDGRADDALLILRESSTVEIQWLNGVDHRTGPLEAAIDQAAVGYRQYLEQFKDHSTGSMAILQAAAQLRVLCAHRTGLRGELTLNQRIVERLTSEGLLSPYAGDSFGRLVMVSRNDYRLNLFNGDVGIIAQAEDGSRLPTSAGRGQMIVLEEPSEESGVRRVPASLVPGVQDCFAMTIHRSQGSEFRQVVLVLPEHDSPVLSRELLYTAVTRVKESRDPTSGQVRRGFLCVVGSESVLRGAIARCIHRASGLSDGIRSRTSQA